MNISLKLNKNVLKYIETNYKTKITENNTITFFDKYKIFSISDNSLYTNNEDIIKFKSVFSKYNFTPSIAFDNHLNTYIELPFDNVWEIQNISYCESIGDFKLYLKNNSSSVSISIPSKLALGHKNEIYNKCIKYTSIDSIIDEMILDHNLTEYTTLDMIRNIDAFQGKHINDDITLNVHTVDYSLKEAIKNDLINENLDEKYDLDDIINNYIQNQNLKVFKDIKINIKEFILEYGSLKSINIENNNFEFIYESTCSLYPNITIYTRC